MRTDKKKCTTTGLPDSRAKYDFVSGLVLHDEILLGQNHGRMHRSANEYSYVLFS